MKAKDIMTPEVKTINQEKTVYEAAQLMADHNIGSLPVSDNGNITGIVTDRDIVIRSTSKGNDPKKIKVKEVMSPRVVTCYQDQDIEELAEKMEKFRVRRIPIIDSNENLVGIISVGDISIRYNQKRASKVLENVCEPE